MSPQKQVSHSHKLIVISAPSGAGKTTLCHRLLADFPKLLLSISTTSRKPRGQEKNEIDYNFVSPEVFKKMIDNHEFAEWALVHGNYYGTSMNVIQSAFDKDRAVLLDIDVQGAESLRKAFPKETFSVFISPPSLEILEERLRNRKTDEEASIQRRIENARTEMKAAPFFQKIVINDNLETAYQELKRLVLEELNS